MIRSIIGHVEAVAAINRSIAEGRLAHAYLFCGPSGIGKGALALELAKAVSCPSADPPCRECSVCRRIDAGKHPDVEVIAPGGICDEAEHDHATDAGRDIRICQVRRIERVLGLAPFEGQRRVIIVDPADAMNAQAADAFLKTLEEPPDRAVILLVTATEEGLSETVRSRCRRVALRALRPSETEHALVERFGATPDHAARLSRIFGGRIGRAVDALRDPDFDVRRAAALDLASRVASSGVEPRFAEAQRLADAFARRERAKGEAGGEQSEAAPPKDGKARTRTEVFIVLDTWVEWWRDLLLVAGGADAAIVNAERASDLRVQADRLGVESAAAGVRAIRQARRDLEQNVNPRLALEALMLRLPSAIEPPEVIRAGGRRAVVAASAAGASERTP
ncbi:MAG: ATP-binding protein [Dehalococcoidia bacterium]